MNAYENGPQAIENFLKKFWKHIQDPRRRVIYETNEEAVRVNFFVSLLELLGWDISDPLEVEFEYQTTEGDKIDIALKRNYKPAFIWEIKALNKLDSTSELTKAKKQLGKYMAQVDGDTYFGLTDGINWFLFLKQKIDDYVKISFSPENLNEFFKLICLLSCLQPTNKAIDVFAECLQSCNYLINKAISSYEEKIEVIKRFFWSELDNIRKNSILKLSEQRSFSVQNKNQTQQITSHHNIKFNRKTETCQEKIFGNRNIVMEIEFPSGDIRKIEVSRFGKLIDELIRTLIEMGIINLYQIPKLGKYPLLAKEENNAGARPGKIKINNESWYVYRGGTNRELQLKYLAKLLTDIVNVKKVQIEDKTNSKKYILDIERKRFIEK
jgi:predicted type IV restriction endonuclease